MGTSIIYHLQHILCDIVHNAFVIATCCVVLVSVDPCLCDISLVQRQKPDENLENPKTSKTDHLIALELPDWTWILIHHQYEKMSGVWCNWPTDKMIGLLSHWNWEGLISSFWEGCERLYPDLQYKNESSDEGPLALQIFTLDTESITETVWGFCLGLMLSSTKIKWMHLSRRCT